MPKAKKLQLVACDYCGTKFDIALRNEKASHEDFCVCPSDDCLEAHGHYLQQVLRNEDFFDPFEE